jgi:hypothetical protein
MSYVGYSTTAAIGRLATLAKPSGLDDKKRLNGVRTAVQTMEALRLGPAPNSVGGTGPVIGAASPAKTIQATLGASREKAEAIAAYLNPKDKVVQEFLSRMQRNAGVLKPHLHFNGDSKLSPAGRIAARTALCLAFGQGADARELGKLRVILESAPEGAGLSKFVIHQLKKSDANVGGLIDSLPAPGQRYFKKRDFGFGANTGLASTDWERYKNSANEFIQNRGDDYEDVQREVFAAIRHYTGTGYGLLNQHHLGLLEVDNLEEDDRKKLIRNLDRYTKVMDYGLAQLPDWSGMTMRGVVLDPDVIARKYKPGTTVTEKFFQSTSATKGFEEPVQFIIHVEHGKNISELSTFSQDTKDGVEILIPRDAQFKVLANEKVGDRTVVVLSELGYH